MDRTARRAASFLLSFAALAAQAQTAPPAPAASAAAPAASRPVAQGPDLRKACTDLAPSARDPKSLGLRAQCVLTGLHPSTRRFGQARELAREAMKLGDAHGALVLYLAFSTDPENTYVRDGKADLARYRQLGARTLEQRRDQVEALDALGYAAGTGHAQAMSLLASYHYDTAAPTSIARVRETTGLLMRSGLRTELNDRMLKEATAINDVAPQTKASVRSFLDAYRLASAVALRTAAQVAAPGVSAPVATASAPGSTAAKCEKPGLRNVSAGDLKDPQFLPLQNSLVANTFLLRGSWTEYWTFDACGLEVPVKVDFNADGWGGTTFNATLNR